MKRRSRFRRISLDCRDTSGPLYERVTTFSDENDWHDNPVPYYDNMAALHRHLDAFEAGEGMDPDGQHHLASVAWRALVELVYQTEGTRDTSL